MYSVYNHWDKLKVCAVGRSYPPEFYSFINNPRLRSLFEKIAIETEEDYQGLINKLHEFGVETVRPNVPNIVPEKYYNSGLRIPGPVSMNPRDAMIMIGEEFFIFPYDYTVKKVSGRIERHEINDYNSFQLDTKNLIDWWQPILEKLRLGGNIIHDHRFEEGNLLSLLREIKVNGITRIGKDLYFGTHWFDVKEKLQTVICSKKFVKKYLKNEYRTHYIETDGHMDGSFTPVKPGLIVSSYGIEEYEKTFPDWEIIELPHQQEMLNDWVELKKKNKGKWWIANSENDDDLISFIEIWLSDWLGYVEETVFDVNALVVDDKNILVTGFNKIAFDAYERHGVTPHIVPMRHRWFWDGGLSCVTAELHREGVMQDWFPERG